MGTWGPAISSNDTYADVYSQFFDLYNEGGEVTEISGKLIADYQQTISDVDDGNNFWFALAKAQWECKQLDLTLFDRVKQIIESEADLEVWRNLDANEKDIKKRKANLHKFLAKLQVEKPKAKARKKKKIRQAIFQKGDCLIYKLTNGNYSGAVVLEAIKDREYAYNLIASTRINQPQKPSIVDFENAEVLVLNYNHWENIPNIKWYFPKRHGESEDSIEKLGEIAVEFEYDIEKHSYGYVADFGIWFIQITDMQFESEKNNPEPEKKSTIKELTKNKWKFLKSDNER